MNLSLKNPKLFHQDAFVAGHWQSAKSGDTLDVNNPFTGEIIGTVPSLSSDEATEAVRLSHLAFADWSAKSASDRAKILHRWADLIDDNADDLALIMTSEQGKPLNEAKGEILYANSFIRWFADEAKRIYGDVIPSPNTRLRYVVLKQPIGVCAAITPWNFPSAMITRKVAPALAAGCTMIVRPATETPFSALALAHLAKQAGVPDGVLSVITGKSGDIGKVLTGDDRIKKLSFTGSTEVGRILMEQCASTIKKLSLELGGNAPFIVFDDADIDKAVDGAIASKYRNAGQTCVCANRIYVQRVIKDEFVAKFKAKVESLTVGNGLTAGVDVSCRARA